MTNRFMMSVAAAALIAGAGFANAQGTGGGSAGSTAQQSAPSTGGTTAAPANRDASEPSSGMKATQSDQKSPGGAKNQRAQDDMKAGAKGEKSAQEKVQNKSAQDKSAQDNNKGDKSKSMSSETKGPAAKDMKAEGRNGNMNAETKGAAENGSQTTGQAGAGARLSTEQRTKISTVIRGQHVEPITNANFAISVGARVPREVSFRRLPSEVITVYPEWRGYEFFLVRDQIIVVNPRTMEIVAVLDA